eukprot:Sspe_Gene.96520::Locus_69349_Transcript_1_1_Confidence_1.000_Length_2082::g.96520::m.96520
MAEVPLSDTEIAKVVAVYEHSQSTGGITDDWRLRNVLQQLGIYLTSAQISEVMEGVRYHDRLGFEAFKKVVERSKVIISAEGSKRTAADINPDAVLDAFTAMQQWKQTDEPEDDDSTHDGQPVSSHPSFREEAIPLDDIRRTLEGFGVRTPCDYRFSPKVETISISDFDQFMREGQEGDPPWVRFENTLRRDPGEGIGCAPKDLWKVVKAKVRSKELFMLDAQRSETWKELLKVRVKRTRVKQTIPSHTTAKEDSAVEQPTTQSLMDMLRNTEHRAMVTPPIDPRIPGRASRKLLQRSPQAVVSAPLSSIESHLLPRRRRRRVLHCSSATSHNLTWARCSPALAVNGKIASRLTVGGGRALAYGPAVRVAKRCTWGMRVVGIPESIAIGITFAKDTGFDEDLHLQPCSLVFRSTLTTQGGQGEVWSLGNLISVTPIPIVAGDLVGVSVSTQGDVVTLSIARNREWVGSTSCSSRSVPPTIFPAVQIGNRGVSVIFEDVASGNTETLGSLFSLTNLAAASMEGGVAEPQASQGQMDRWVSTKAKRSKERKPVSTSAFAKRVRAAVTNIEEGVSFEGKLTSYTIPSKNDRLICRSDSGEIPTYLASALLLTHKSGSKTLQGSKPQLHKYLVQHLPHFHSGSSSLQVVRQRPFSSLDERRAYFDF